MQFGLQTNTQSVTFLDLAKLALLEQCLQHHTHSTKQAHFAKMHMRKKVSHLLVGHIKDKSFKTKHKFQHLHLVEQLILLQHLKQINTPLFITKTTTMQLEKWITEYIHMVTDKMQKQTPMNLLVTHSLVGTQEPMELAKPLLKFITSVQPMVQQSNCSHNGEQTTILFHLMEMAQQTMLKNIHNLLYMEHTSTLKQINMQKTAIHLLVGTPKKLQQLLFIKMQKML